MRENHAICVRVGNPDATACMYEVCSYGVYVHIVHPVAYLGFHLGGVKIFLEKWGNLHGPLRAMQRESHAFARGVRGHAPPKKF